MPLDILAIASDGVPLTSAPINAEHVLAGDPIARNAELYRSADQLQVTLLWHCTAGSFRWYYGDDETILVLRGGMTLHFDNGSSRSCSVGDTVFFPAGTTCVWVIEHEVQKLAFFRKPVPNVIASAMLMGYKIVRKSGIRPLLRRMRSRRAVGRTVKPVSVVRGAAGG